MEIKTHTIDHTPVAEIISSETIIHSSEEALNILGDLYYQGFEHIILHKGNITQEFFDLKNGMAGEILQKFSNYRVRLTIVGTFNEFNSKSLNDFIFESNKGKHINFVATVEDALHKLSK